MSIQSWKDEFYTIEAENVEEKEALQHSLIKWIGLRKKNLERHELGINTNGHLTEVGIYGKVFPIDSSTCALCHFYLNKFDTCRDCPISGKKDYGIDCNGNGNNEPAFSKWLNYADPEPMIKVLRKALKKQKNDCNN